MVSWLLARKWLVALVALVVVASVGGVYAWRASGSVGTSGRQDACAAATKSASDDPLMGWIPVTDASPQAMEQLLAAQPLYARTLDGGPLTPGLPILVHPIQMRTGQDFNDCPHWLLPERDDTGHLAAIADYVYDYPHARVRFANAGTLLPNDPRYTAPFPYISTAQAAALLMSARHVAAVTSPAPELVFLPIDVGLPEAPGSGVDWNGGGVVPSDAIWLLAGADGQDYFIGTNHKVYTLRDIPLS